MFGVTHQLYDTIYDRKYTAYHYFGISFFLYLVISILHYDAFSSSLDYLKYLIIFFYLPLHSQSIDFPVE